MNKNETSMRLDESSKECGIIYCVKRIEGVLGLVGGGMCTIE